MTAPWAEVDLPREIFDRLRAAAPDGPWLRLIYRVERQREGDQYVYPAMGQKILFVPPDRIVAEPNIDMDASAEFLTSLYFQDDFDRPGWTMVWISCDADGAQSAWVQAAADGPPQATYTGHSSDPFFAWADDHQPELRDLAARIHR